MQPPYDSSIHHMGISTPYITAVACWHTKILGLYLAAPRSLRISAVGRLGFGGVWFRV